MNSTQTAVLREWWPMGDELEGGTCRECNANAETFDQLLAHSDETGHWVLFTPGA